MVKRFPGRLALLIALYTLIAIASIYPASVEPSQRIVGGGELGGWLWRYWWMKLEIRALATEMAGHPLQLFLHIISLGRFPETGNVTDLYALSLPLDLLFGHPAYYNIKCMVIVVTNGLAGYALSRAFTRSPFIAFAGGAVLAMNALVALEFFGSGLRQAILAPGAMAVLSFERLWARGRARDGVATGVWFGLVAAFYWFYGLFLFLYALGRTLAALPGWLRSDRRGRTLMVLVGAALIGGAIAGVFAYPYYMFELDHTGKLPEVSYLSDFPDLKTLLAASEFPRTPEENLMASLKRVLISSWQLDSLWSPVHPRNATLAVFVVGVLGALLRIRRTWFWVLAMAFFWLHTGGPYLMELGNPFERLYVDVGGEPLRLPYAYTFKFVPLMSRLFAPYRAAGFMWVMLAVLCVISLESLRALMAEGRRGLTRVLPAPHAAEPTFAPEGQVGGDRRSDAALALVFVAAFFGQQFGDNAVLEWLSPDQAGSLGRGLPVYNSTIRIPPFYEALGQEEGLVGVVELPMHVQQDLITYYQVVHEKKVLKGWAEPGALPPYLRFVREPKSEVTRQLQFLSAPDSNGPNSFVEAMSSLSQPPYKLKNYDAGDLQTLARGGFRYVILHERGCYLLWPDQGGALYEALRRRLTASLGRAAEVVEVVEDDDPQAAALRPHTGLLGSWASSALPMTSPNRPTRFHMAIFLIPGGGWGGAWQDAIDWPLRVRASAAQLKAAAAAAQEPPAAERSGAGESPPPETAAAQPAGDEVSSGGQASPVGEGQASRTPGSAGEGTTGQEGAAPLSTAPQGAPTAAEQAPPEGEAEGPAAAPTGPPEVEVGPAPPPAAPTELPPEGPAPGVNPP